MQALEQIQAQAQAEAQAQWTAQEAKLTANVRFAGMLCAKPCHISLVARLTDKLSFLWPRTEIQREIKSLAELAWRE